MAQRPDSDVENAENLQKQESLNHFGIFPNPTNGLVNFNFSNDDNYRILLTDPFGREIVSFNCMNGECELDMNEFGSGIYICRIFDGEELIMSEKLIKL